MTRISFPIIEYNADAFPYNPRLQELYQERRFALPHSAPEKPGLNYSRFGKDK
ncbi:MAG: hypothetical protein JW716_03670 [Candidatus Aenigmarchaeota archaeon]|nr:hypothetical protein [Candidatus Aenigmarchaeota archaeon]